MDEFFKTRLGHEYLRGTLPGLVKQIGRLADSVTALNETLGSRPDAREGVGPRARPRVLIVDDDEQILRGLARGLKQDHDVLLATSPAVALAMAEAHALDAVVTDHDLGDDQGRDGVWLLEQVRRRHAQARRILMSGGQGDVDDHVQSGLVARFLPKPVNPAAVRAALHAKVCAKCGAAITDPQLQGDELCARCGDPS